MSGMKVSCFSTIISQSALEEANYTISLMRLVEGLSIPEELLGTNFPVHVTTSWLITNFDLEKSIITRTFIEDKDGSRTSIFEGRSVKLSDMNVDDDSIRIIIRTDGLEIPDREGLYFLRVEHKVLNEDGSAESEWMQHDAYWPLRINIAKD